MHKNVYENRTSSIAKEVSHLCQSSLLYINRTLYALLRFVYIVLANGTILALEKRSSKCILSRTSETTYSLPPEVRTPSRPTIVRSLETHFDFSTSAFRKYVHLHSGASVFVIAHVFSRY